MVPKKLSVKVGTAVNFVNKSPSEPHNVVFGPQKYIEGLMKKVDLLPAGPGSPNQAPPFFAYGSDPPGSYSYDGTNHGNGFLTTPLTDAQPGVPPRGLFGAARVSFTKAGTFKYFCLLHGPDMGGEIVRRAVTKHRRRGLGALALLALAGLVLLGGTFALAGPGPVVREYWVAAVPVTWNVVPNGRNAVEGETFTRDETTLRTIVYKRYTKGWGRPLGDDPAVAGDNDGIPGPLLRARVGDTILVHFKNLDNEFERSHSMHFHGVEYEFGSDGAYIPGFSGKGANVKPGETFTYRLEARAADSAGVWPYHDHSPSMSDSIHGGMYGALSILGPKSSRRTASSSSTSGRCTTSTRSTGARSSGTRPSTGPRSVRSCSGTCSRSATTTTRSTCTATGGWRLGACPRTRARSGRPRASPCAGRRTPPARGSTTATSRST